MTFFLNIMQFHGLFVFIYISKMVFPYTFVSLSANAIKSTLIMHKFCAADFKILHFDSYTESSHKI